MQLAWDEGPPWTFRLEIVHASGDEAFSIDGALVRGDGAPGDSRSRGWSSSGYIFHGRPHRAAGDPRGAFAWLAQLRRSGPMVIPPGATGQLLDVLARSGVDPSDLPEELQFEIANESPRAVRQRARRRARRRHRRRAASTRPSAFDYGGMSRRPGSGFDDVRFAIAGG